VIGYESLGSHTELELDDEGEGDRGPTSRRVVGWGSRLMDMGLGGCWKGGEEVGMTLGSLGMIQSGRGMIGGRAGRCPTTTIRLWLYTNLYDDDSLVLVFYLSLSTYLC